MTTITIIGTFSGQVELREVEALFVEGCVAVHVGDSEPACLTLTHVPTGRAIVAFPPDTAEDELHRAARDFDALLRDLPLQPSWDNAPLLSRKDATVRACWEIAFQYADCMFIGGSQQP